MKSKKAILFGGTGDLGIEVSKYLLLNNYKLIITYKNKIKKKKLESRLSTFKGKFHLIYCDLEKENLITKIFSFAKEKFKTIDLVINTSGIFNYDNINNLNYEKILSIFKVNSFSLIIINRELKKIKKNKDITKVISIGSSSSLNGFKDTITYCGSKHALLGIIKSLNQTILKDKIINYCLNVGSLKNKMGKKVRNQNYNKFIDQKEVVKAIQFLISMDPHAVPEDIFIKRFV